MQLPHRIIYKFYQCRKWNIVSRLCGQHYVIRWRIQDFIIMINSFVLHAQSKRRYLVKQKMMKFLCQIHSAFPHKRRGGFEKCKKGHKRAQNVSVRHCLCNAALQALSFPKISYRPTICKFYNSGIGIIIALIRIFMSDNRMQLSKVW